MSPDSINGWVKIPLEYYERLKRAADAEAKQTDAKHEEVKSLQQKLSKQEHRLEFYHLCFAVWTKHLIGEGLDSGAYKKAVTERIDGFNAKGTIAEFRLEEKDKKIFIFPINKTDELL